MPHNTHGTLYRQWIYKDSEVERVWLVKMVKMKVNKTEDRRQGELPVSATATNPRHTVKLMPKEELTEHRGKFAMTGCI
jgi:hypothetical protein